MMAAHHAGADQAYAKRLVHGRSGRVMTGSQHARISLSIIQAAQDIFCGFLGQIIKY
jgi:hypothetical protein